MPRPLTVVPCTAAACCELCAAAIAEVAISICVWVARWLSQASVTSRTAATTASMPIQKCSMKADKQEHRSPRRIEHRGDDRRRHRRPDRIEIAHGLACRAGIRGHHLLEDARREQGVDALAGADQQPVADHVEGRQRKQRQRQRQRDEQQGRLAAGRHHPVVDLQHVQRRREIEDVDQQAETPRPR